MSQQIPSDAAAQRAFVVSDSDTALAVGSGSLPVLGTPRLLAWCEAVTCAAADPHLESGSTSVGTRIQLEHLAASSVGDQVEVSAAVTHRDGRLLRFTVSAREPATHAGAGKLLATGEVTRVIVNADKFLSRLHKTGGH